MGLVLIIMTAGALVVGGILVWAATLLPILIGLLVNAMVKDEETKERVSKISYIASIIVGGLGTLAVFIIILGLWGKGLP